MTISAYKQPTDLIFGTVLDIFNIFYHTKNQVGELCLAGVSNKTRRFSHGHCESLIWNSAYTQPTYLIFGMVKDTDNIYYCTKNQAREFCVDRDMVILFVGSFHGKMTISPPTHNPRIWFFGKVIDIVSIFYHTKNQVGGLCVGGVSNEIRRS